MRGINKVILVGNVGKIDTRFTQDGKAVANISIATSESWKDKTTGEKKESVEWHKVVFFGKLAEIANEYVKVGAQLYIEGKLQTRKWQDKQGQDRYTTEIVGSELQMLGGKREGQPEAPQENRSPSATKDHVADFDDDIPF